MLLGPGNSGGGARLQAAEGRQDFDRLPPLPVIGIEVGVHDETVRRDDVARLHGQKPTRIGVLSSRLANLLFDSP